MALFEDYVEGIMLKNQDLYDLARSQRDEKRMRSTVVARTMHALLHNRITIIEPGQDVMAEISSKLSTHEMVAQAPLQALYPTLPDDPLLLDLTNTETKIAEIPAYPPIAGMVFQCPGDREVMRLARTRLPAKFHEAIDSIVSHDQTTWTLSCLDSLGEVFLTYHYREDEPGVRSWQLYGGHTCPFHQCKYAPQGGLVAPCIRCESTQVLLSMIFGFSLLYDSGYYQEIVIKETVETRRYTGKDEHQAASTNETTRPVKVRRIRKNVLLKEVSPTKPVVTIRGSWLAKHEPEEIFVLEKKRKPFDMHTRSGKLIRVTPTKKKRIPMLKKNVPERTIIELYAEPRTTEEQEERKTKG